MAGDTLSSGSLEWALTHISKFGDTDIFPVPFEFKSIRHGWNRIKSELEKSDLTTYLTRGSRRLLVPKPGGGFRVVRDRHEISVSSYATIRTNCIVPFSVERVGTNIYLCDLLF